MRAGHKNRAPLRGLTPVFAKPKGAEMVLEFVQLVIPKQAYDSTGVLCGWAELVGPDLSILLPTRLGHLFLEHADGTIWFLNTWSGELAQACVTYDEFKARVTGDDEFISSYLMPEVVAALLESGHTADGDGCYSAIVSPGDQASLRDSRHTNPSSGTFSV